MGQKVPLGSAASSGVTDWTPSITFLTPGASAWTTIAGVGKYVRNGSLLVANFRMSPNASSISGASGALCIIGLPVPIEAVFAATASGFVAELDNLTWPATVSQAVLQPIVSGPNAGLGMLLLGMGNGDQANGGSVPFGPASVTVGTQFHLRGSISYYTAD